jgi:flagellar protein FlaF
MNAHKTYTKIQKETLSGRDVEVQVLRKAATQYRQVLEAVGDADKNKLLDAAVRYNLRVWDVFQADWERPDCPLSPQLRSDLLRLSLYVHRNSLDVLAYASPDKIRTLININECLAEGLLTGSRTPIPSLASA